MFVCYVMECLEGAYYANLHYELYYIETCVNLIQVSIFFEIF